MPSVTFKGNGAFEDRHEPVPSKSEWGMDVITRAYRGKQSLLTAFINSLAQGQTTSYNSRSYYLQSWDCDNDLVFPTVTCIYKGLFDGIPDPFVTGGQIEQTFSLSTDSPENASRDIRYITRRSVYKYINSGRPTGPTYTALDVDTDIEVIQSVIRTEDGRVLFGSADAGLVTALTPAEYNLALLEDCTPVFGTIYFECTDSVTKLYGP